MSIFNFISTRQKFRGNIQTNENKFGFFSMNTQTVKTSLSSNLGDINRNMKAKNVAGKVEFCKFDNHDGKILLIRNCLIFM